MIDFSHTIYIDLIEALRNKKSSIITFKDFISLNRDNMHSKNGNIIIRHDVDRKPFNALKIAKIESELNIKASYYFRIVPESYDVKVISEIAKMGHEIGYHYEDVDLVVKSNKDKLLDRENLINKAYLSFCNNLSILRKDFDIHTHDNTLGGLFKNLHFQLNTSVYDLMGAYYIGGLDKDNSYSYKITKINHWIFKNIKDTIIGIYNKRRFPNPK